MNHEKPVSQKPVFGQQKSTPSRSFYLLKTVYPKLFAALRETYFQGGDFGKTRWESRLFGRVPVNDAGMLFFAAEKAWEHCLRFHPHWANRKGLDVALANEVRFLWQHFGGRNTLERPAPYLGKAFIELVSKRPESLKAICDLYR